MSEFKLKKARGEHVCDKCASVIEVGEEYYCEEKFLGSLHKPLQKYCLKCFKK